MPTFSELHCNNPDCATAPIQGMTGTSLLFRADLASPILLACHLAQLLSPGYEDANPRQNTVLCTERRTDLFLCPLYGILNRPTAPRPTNAYIPSSVFSGVGRLSSARIPRADCPSETSRRQTFVCLITGTMRGSPLLTPGHATTRGPSLFGLW